LSKTKKETNFMMANSRDLAILLLEGGCSRLLLPPSTGEELYMFLDMCRKNQASREDMSPSSKLDTLWHWMLLNTDVSTCVHDTLGGIVPHSTMTESDSVEKKNKRRRLSMNRMRSMGYSPRPELWDDESPGEGGIYVHDDDDDDSCYEYDLATNHQSGDFPKGHRSRRLDTSIPKRNVFKEKSFDIIVLFSTGKRIRMLVTASTTVDRIKSALHNRKGIPADQQILVHDGIRLDSNRTLRECEITDDTAIDLIVQQTGC